jgi:DNA polymerase III subunit epsilon
MLIRECGSAKAKDVCPQDNARIKPSFVALDVETANLRPSSICEIAAIRFSDGLAVEIWHSPIDPEQPFAPLHVALHGIHRCSLRDAPSFPNVISTLSSLLTGNVVASHTAFDRVALRQACLKYALPEVQCTWLDTAAVARRAWPRFAKRGYGLKSLACWCGFDFKHHNAAEDARTAGHILMRAVADTGTTVDEWVERLLKSRPND